MYPLDTGNKQHITWLRAFQSHLDNSFSKFPSHPGWCLGFSAHSFRNLLAVSPSPCLSASQGGVVTLSCLSLVLPGALMAQTGAKPMVTNPRSAKEQPACSAAFLC